jgi:hypothetical protein
MRYNGKRWNNILILSVIVFILLLNLPTLIKTYLMAPSEPAQAESSQEEGAPTPTMSAPTLLNPNHTLTALNFAHWSLAIGAEHWRSSQPMTITEDEAVERWQTLTGTAVDEETYQKLIATLPAPSSIEVWYQNLDQPQRITYYQTPKFWLFKNYHDIWIAVSVDEAYLFPFK